MRLSDIKGERTLDVVAEVIDPIANIAMDQNAAALFKREALKPGETPRAAMMARLKRSVPSLLKEHKDDIVAILAAIGGVPPAQYAEQLNLVTLTKDLIELVTDQDFITLFISAQSGTSSGSARESTTGQEA